MAALAAADAAAANDGVFGADVELLDRFVDAAAGTEMAAVLEGEAALAEPPPPPLHGVGEPLADVGAGEPTAATALAADDDGEAGCNRAWCWP